MATVIDTLFLELGIDSGKFGTQAKEAENRLDRMSASFGRAEKSAAKSSKGLEKQAVQSAKSTKQAKSLTQAVGSLAKGFAAFTALVMGSNALDKMIREGARANVELDNLSRNIGMSRNQLQAWGGMAEMAGGSAEGMKGSLAGLSMGITRLTTMGDTSMVPFFNAFGVALLNADGKARDLDSIMLDLSDRFSKMDRVQAYNLAKSMGLDDGTINTLMLGRAEMEKMLEMQRNLYRSGEKEIQVSRELTQARGYLNAQWDSLKAMLADALAPVLLKIIKMVSGFVDYLMKHENSMKHVFEGLAFVLGAVLIPVFIAATASLLAFIAPFAPFILTVGALGAAFLLLYDDYKTWAEGGKSLFDWGAFTGYIKTSKVSVDSLKSAFVYLLTGYKSWAEAGNAAFDWLRLKGFIDENGVSLRSLANGFKSLAQDIYQFVAPALEDIGEIFTALGNKDYNLAWEAAKRLASRPVNFVFEQVQNVAERVSGAVDVATGHDPDAEGSLQSQVKNATGTAKQMIGGTAAAKVTIARKNGGGNPSALAADYGGGKAGSASGKGNIRNYSTARGSFQKVGGSRAWRNNNEGNLEFGKFAKAHGAIGTDGRFAIFPDEETGRRAKEALIFESNGGKYLANNPLDYGKGIGYRDKTLLQMIAAYAPSGENNTRAYRQRVLAAVGGRNKKMRDYTADERQAIMQAMRKVEGWKAGQIRHLDDVAAGAQRGMQSMRQGEAVRAQNVTNNNQRTTQVSINGGIHVQSSASTIAGTMDDASAAARNRLVQIMPAMV
ncbi:hypothetical protein [Neisseria polysaccharea]|uniref:hypothetical protein n=1 Tax=Neisseria polysaccharea TaxID=489 RepID=UPI00272A9E9D|nr:hypothetical protein [Neisseria polysaccharea]